MVDSDIDLMLRCQKGEEASFEELVRRYQKRVIYTVYRYTGDRTEAEDLTQEVFLRVYNARQSYQPTSKFESWIFTIVNNICLNEIRNRKRRRVQSIFTDGSNPQINIAGQQKTASSQLRGWELQITVRSALDSLPDSQRMAVILNKFENFSYEDIAQMMKMTVPAVKSLLFRARENLKEKLKSYM